MKRTPYINQETGEYNLKYNMQNLLEDFYIPVRGNDTATKIDNANGLQWDGIQDVEYLRNKYKDHKYYKDTLNFCEKWDQASFDPNYKSLTLKDFEPLVRKIFARKPYEN